jgi:hypothetical protein
MCACDLEESTRPAILQQQLRDGGGKGLDHACAHTRTHARTHDAIKNAYARTHQHIGTYPPPLSPTLGAYEGGVLTCTCMCGRRYGALFAILPLKETSACPITNTPATPFPQIRVPPPTPPHLSRDARPWSGDRGGNRPSRSGSFCLALASRNDDLRRNQLRRSA